MLEQKDLSRKQMKPVREIFGESKREQWTYQIPRFSSTHLSMWDNKLHIHPYNNHLVSFFLQKAKAKAISVGGANMINGNYFAQYAMHNYVLIENDWKTDGFDLFHCHANALNKFTTVHVFPPTIQLHLDCFNGKYVQRPVTEHLFSLEQMEMSVAVARNKNVTSKTSEMKSLLHQLAI